MTDRTGLRAQTYPWYVVGVLTVAYTVSFIDRQILNLLVDPIRQDLGISDTQISLLQGLGFAIFYSVMGLPIARLADRSNRRNIITAGIFLWCAMTVACGFARSYLQLFIARIGVGVGEAALSPPAYSIIADYFPSHRRARATGTYSLGVYLGSGIAMLVGGASIEAISRLGPIELPLLGDFQPWQLTFMVVGLPGLLVGALMFTIREPQREISRNQETITSAAVSWRELLEFFITEKRALTSIFVGYSLMGIVMIAFLSWIPTFFIRVHHWDVGTVGVAYGWVLLLFGTSGAVAGGWFSDYLHSRGVNNSPIKTTILVCVLALPFAVATPLVNDAWLSLTLLAPTTFLLSSPVGLSAAKIQNLAPSRMRAQVTALYLMVVAFIGTGFGPIVVAVITDYVFANDAAVGYSLALVALVTIPLGSGSLYLGLGARGRSNVEKDTTSAAAP